jgi:hypothetical protein
MQAPPCQPSSAPVLAVLHSLEQRQQQQQQQQQQEQPSFSVVDAAAGDAGPAWQVPAAWEQVGDVLATMQCVLWTAYQE